MFDGVLFSSWFYSCNLEYRDVIEAYLIEMKRRGEGNLGTFTESQLLHVLADLFGAGTDTSMTIIKWILLYMILYPDIQVC